MARRGTRTTRTTPKDEQSDRTRKTAKHNKTHTPRKANKAHLSKKEKRARRNEKRSAGDLVQLSPLRLGDVVAGEAARNQRIGTQEPYLNFLYFLARSSIVNVASIDPDRLYGTPEPIGELWRELIPITKLSSDEAGPEYVFAVAGDVRGGWRYGFKNVARDRREGVLWPVPLVPGHTPGLRWGFAAGSGESGVRFPVRDGGRRRSSVVSPTCVSFK